MFINLSVYNIVKFQQSKCILFFEIEAKKNGFVYKKKETINRQSLFESSPKVSI